MHRRVRGLVVFAAGVAVLAASAFAAPAASAETAPEDGDEGLVELHISAGSNGVIAVGSPLSATVTIVNDTDQQLSAGRLALELNRTPLADSAAVEAWLTEGTSTGPFAGLATESSSPVDAAGTSSAGMLVPVEELGHLAPGVYPLRATLSGATTGDLQEDTLTSRNVTAAGVLVVDDGQRPQITTIVPITATPENGDLLGAEELAQLTGPDGTLAAQLDGVAGTGAVLAVDPAIPAAIRVLGQSAPASATAWLARLEVLPNERFALQFADADPAVQAQAGLTELLSPPSLAPYLDPADFTAGSGTPTPTPTPTPEPVQPVLPDDAELTGIRGAVPGLLWPTGDVTTADLAAFAGYVDDEVTTILPSTSAAAGTAAHGRVDDHDILLTSPAASTAFSEAAGAEDPFIRQEALAEGLAHLALAPQADRVLIGLDRDETRPADALQATITAVATTAVPATLASLRASEPATLTLDAPPSAARATTLQALLGEEDDLRSFASILDDPQLLLTPERIRLMRVIAVGAAGRFDDAVAEHRARTAATLDAVGVQQPSAIQLFTSAAPLPVWVRNDLPWPVNVRLSAEPSDARLDVQPFTDVVAQPSSNTRVKVPVEARVGSGALQVRFSLTSPTGVPIGDVQRADVTVRAEWEGIGLGILGGVIALLLVLGLVRTVRRRRREDVADTSGTSGARPDDDSDATGGSARE